MYSISKGEKEVSAVGTAVDVLLECNFEILKALNTSTQFHLISKLITKGAQDFVCFWS